MSKATLAGILALAIAGGTLYAEDGDVKAKAQELVKQLSSDDPAVREQATDELSKLGAEAASVLEEASKSADPEVAWRAEKALSKIRGGESEEEQGESPKKQTKRPQNGSSSTTMVVRIMGPGSYTMSQDSNGHITLTVTENDENGKAARKTYEADSMEEFKTKFPEVAKKYGIGEDGVAQMPQILQPPDMKEMEDLLKNLGQGLPKAFQDMLRQLQGRGRRPRDPQAQPPAPVPQDDEPQEGEAAAPAATSPDEFGAEVSFIDPALRDQLDLPGETGVIVEGVVKGSRAAQAGLEPHDVILSVNGEPLKTKWDFRRLLLEGAKTGKVELEIVRKGEKRTLTVDPSLLK